MAAVEPPTLAQAGKGGLKRGEHRQQREADPGAPLHFPDHGNEADVRGVLYASQGRVCGFCGSLLPQNDRGDVEHYRPKNSVKSGARIEAPNGGYWWLAYELGNYLLSCSRCNRTLKRTKFPLRDEARRLRYDTRKDLAAEDPVLAHPAWEDLEDWVIADLENGILEPAPGLDAEQRRRVEAIGEFFRWNRDALLVQDRRRVISEALRCLEDGREDAVRVMASRHSRHSLLVVQLLKQLNREELIPSADEERQSMAIEVLAELEIEPGEEERLWVLRTLWELSGAAVRGWLEQRWEEAGCRVEVEKLRF